MKKLTFDELTEEMLVLENEEMSGIKGGYGEAGSYGGYDYEGYGGGTPSGDTIDGGMLPGATVTAPSTQDSGGSVAGSSFPPPSSDRGESTLETFRNLNESAVDGGYGAGPGNGYDWQSIDSYINAHGGWENWRGGDVPGYGYVAPYAVATPDLINTITNSDLYFGINAAATATGMSIGVTETYAHVEQLLGGGKSVPGSWKVAGKVSGIAGVMDNSAQIWAEGLNWNDAAQIAVGAAILVVPVSGPVALLVGGTLLVWEFAEEYHGW